MEQLASSDVYSDLALVAVALGVEEVVEINESQVTDCLKGIVTSNNGWGCLLSAFKYFAHHPVAPYQLEVSVFMLEWLDIRQRKFAGFPDSELQFWELQHPIYDRFDFETCGAMLRLILGIRNTGGWYHRHEVGEIARRWCSYLRHRKSEGVSPG